MTDKQQPPARTVPASIHPSEKGGYVKIEADVPMAAIQPEEQPASGAPPSEPGPQAADSTPPPSKTTANVAGYGVDDILKAPLQPPEPKPGEHGPPLAEKMNQAGYQVSQGVGPKKPGMVNLVLVGLGVFICLLGLVGFFYLGFGMALTILVIGFVTTVGGTAIKF